MEVRRNNLRKLRTQVSCFCDDMNVMDISSCLAGWRKMVSFGRLTVRRCFPLRVAFFWNHPCPWWNTRTLSSHVLTDDYANANRCSIDCALTGLECIMFNQHGGGTKDGTNGTATNRRTAAPSKPTMVSKAGRQVLVSLEPHQSLSLLLIKPCNVIPSKTYASLSTIRAKWSPTSIRRAPWPPKNPKSRNIKLHVFLHADAAVVLQTNNLKSSTGIRRNRQSVRRRRQIWVVMQNHLP